MSANPDPHIIRHNDELLVSHNGKWVEAQGIDTDDDGDFFRVMASPLFETIKAAKEWIDAGSPEPGGVSTCTRRRQP